MTTTLAFTDSDLARFAHETDRRIERAAIPPDKLQAMQLLRSQPNPRDRTLSTLAKGWRDKLPEGLRPNVLCESYPRIANRIALCWGDPVLTTMVMKDLLSDRRGGRRGFPVAIREELVALRDAAERGM
jgi:hypothetical protein